MFDQGLAQAFGFNHEAAIRSFERAAELDPSAPMPHWGKAWALGPNYNLDIDEARAKAAYDALAKAQSLAAAGPEHEKAYIEALADALLRRIRKPIVPRSRARSARPWAHCRAGIPTISMPP